MNDEAPVGTEPGDSCVHGCAESVPQDNTSGTNTALNHTSLHTPPVPRSPMVFGASPILSKLTDAHTTPRAGVSCLVEYLREERHFRPLALDSHLFPGGLQPGDVVEVWGDTNCGKSMLTLTLIASALLPTEWSGIVLGGCSTGVTLIDCDHHFSIFQLVSLMYKKVKTKLKQAKDALKEHKLGKTTDMTLISNIKEITELLRSDKTSLKIKIEEMVQGCLKSLYYIKCMESLQFPIVLASMDEHLAKTSDVSLVVVDSLSAFCWYDWIYRGGGKFFEVKKYYDKVFSVLVANIKKYKVVLLAVKHALFLKPLEETSRKGLDQHEEKKMSKDDENDNMDEGDSMENMSVSEYFGYTWVSSVTCQVVVSKARCNAKILPRVVGAGAKDSPRSTDVKGDGKETMFSAEVIQGQQNTKLFYAIGEEGVMWR